MMVHGFQETRCDSSCTLTSYTMQIVVASEAVDRCRDCNTAHAASVIDAQNTAILIL